MLTNQQKPILGISIGDINGIGPEIIIKTFSDTRLLSFCTPVIFGNHKVINYYRKGLSDYNLSFQIVKDLNHLNNKQVNIYNCWEEETEVNPGTLSPEAGKYAVMALEMAVKALKDKQIDALVTAPIHKKNVQSERFNFTGHTPYLQHVFGVNESLMLMTSGGFRIALLSEHVPLKDAAAQITKERILAKLAVLHHSLRYDFGIEKPKIAVLGANPHAGDEGLVGDEEEKIIKPAIKEARQQMIVLGPYSADAFFAQNQHIHFDAVLAMYHDQGLIPFKSLATEEGVNFTAGLSGVRTSPDHGTAFDIAGKNKADHESFMAAVFTAVDIINQRKEYNENRKNPLKKVSPVILAKLEDEKIEED